MSDLIVIAFPDPPSAFAARAEFASLQKDYLVEMEDVVVVTRGDDGRVQLHQAVPMTAMGAAGGTLWGTLVGLLFLNPLLGAAVGAGAGALSGALTDIGIDDEFLREVGGSLDHGGAALGVLLHRMTADRVLDRIGQMGMRGRVVQTSLPIDVEARLRAHLEGTAPPAPAHPSLPPSASPAEPAAQSEPAAPPPGLAGAPMPAPAPASAPPGGHGAMTQP
jgi:uncharacterized membrane protein